MTRSWSWHFRQHEISDQPDPKSLLSYTSWCFFALMWSTGHLCSHSTGVHDYPRDCLRLCWWKPQALQSMGLPAGFKPPCLPHPFHNLYEVSDRKSDMQNLNTWSLRFWVVGMPKQNNWNNQLFYGNNMLIFCSFRFIRLHQIIFTVYSSFSKPSSIRSPQEDELLSIYRD